MFRFIVGALSVAILSGCAATSRAYVRAHRDLIVHEGRLIGLEGLPHGRRESLADGVVVRVEEPGCTAVLQNRGDTVSVPLPIGSRIVLGDERDFVLVLRGPLGLEPGPSDPAVGRVEQEPVVELADRALDLLQSGAVEDAREVVAELASRSDAEPEARALGALVERRLELQVKQESVVDSSALVVDPRAAAEAAEIYAEAERHLSAGDRRAALELLERARELDPSSVEITDSLVDLLERMGLAAYSDGDPTTAIELWQRGIALRPDDRELHRYLERARRVEQSP